MHQGDKHLRLVNEIVNYGHESVQLTLMMNDEFDAGMLHQGIFRVSGSINEMINYKAMFERGL